jgi:hypothetical protein
MFASGAKLTLDKILEASDELPVVADRIPVPAKCFPVRGLRDFMRSPPVRSKYCDEVINCAAEISDFPVKFPVCRE